MSKKPRSKASAKQVENKEKVEAEVVAQPAEVAVPVEVEEAAQEQQVEEIVVVSKQPVEEIVVEIVAPKKEAKPVEQAATAISLEQAASQMILGLNSGWLPSIRIRASLMGVETSKNHEPSVWRKVFIAWGGHTIVRP